MTLTETAAALRLVATHVPWCRRTWSGDRTYTPRVLAFILGRVQAGFFAENIVRRVRARMIIAGAWAAASAAREAFRGNLASATAHLAYWIDIRGISLQELLVRTAAPRFVKMFAAAVATECVELYWLARPASPEGRGREWPTRGRRS